jgi:dipeptidyl aminopeptidase/acylaminoacyl peptidase
MKVAAPDRPLDPRPPLDVEALDALIEEARRRARRRRRRQGALVLLAALAMFGVLFGIDRGRGGGSVAGGATPPPPPARGPQTHAKLTPTQPSNANGPLTIIVSESPDGGIYAVGRHGLGRLLVPCSTARGCHDLQSVAWSPDGRRVAFHITSFGRADHPHYNGLHVLDISTGVDRKLTLLGLPLHATRAIAWSRDGTQLALASDIREIAVVNADGTGGRLLPTGTAGRDTSPSWSPDGKRITYATKLGGYWSIYVIDLDGSHRTLLATHASAPAWSPDGKTIAYRACGGIKLMSPAGKDLTSFLPSRCTHFGIAGPPVWSPDGKKIAVARVDRGVYLMNADGSGLRRLTREFGLVPGPRFSQQRLFWRPLPSVVFSRRR